MHEALEGLVDVGHAGVEEHLGPEAGVEQVTHGVLVAAQLRTQLLQPVRPAGSDDDAITTGHELTGELFANA